MSLVAKSVKPYTGVEFDKTVGNYRIITYQAYDAFGLIGSEHNGIAVLNETDKNVVLDQYCRQSSGYDGVGDHVIKKAEELCELLQNDGDAFREFVNNNEHARYNI
jgi:hypothetical protein